MKLFTLSLPIFLTIYVHANPSNPSHGSCTFPSPGITVPSPPPIVSHLLPPTFFQHFQESFLHVTAKDRSSKWDEFISLITPSINEILALNLSTSGGPLRLDDDITLHKTVYTETGRKRQTVDNISGSNVVPASLMTALDDGFAVVVNRMTHRMASVNTLSSSISKEFGVRVTAELTLTPPAFGESIEAEDIFHIILSDRVSANLREGVLRYPFEEHIESLDAIVSEEDLDESKRIEIPLRRGDMLYVPRGDACALPGASILTLRLYTDEITNLDVLQAFIDVANVEEGPLAEPLPGSSQFFTYTDLAKELIDIGGAVTDELRRHFVVGEIDEEGQEDSMEMVSAVTSRFLMAAHAILEPGLSVLREREELGEWAAVVDKEKVEHGFRECIDWLMKKDLVEETVSEVFIKWFERREAEDVEEVRERWEALKRVGESNDWVMFEWE